jgi:hypothetical protein
MRVHTYALDLAWDEPGAGTTHYASYSRRWRISGAGKPALVGSADAVFHGDSGLFNPSLRRPSECVRHSPRSSGSG